MKFRWITAVFIAALGLLAGGSTYLCLREPMPVAAAGENDDLLWLRCEFKLPAEKMVRIEQLHTAYQDVCEEHCRNVRAARVAVKKLRAASALADEILAAEAKAAEMDRICITGLNVHLREIAGVIGGEDGKRYLSIVLPRIAHFDHEGAPNLYLDTNAKTHDHHAHE